MLLSLLFDPENAIKGLSFAKQLQALGCDVEVVTTFPNYPGGKVYPGYKMRAWQVEEIDGVRVVRLPVFLSHSRSVVRRLMLYGSFAAVSLTYAAVFARKPDVFYAYQPPIAAGLTASLSGALRRVPFVYDLQDLWPEALIATGMAREGRVTKVVEWIAGHVYRRAARIIVQSEGYRRALVRKGVPDSKMVCIYNWSDEARATVANSSEQRFLPGGAFNIVYAGNLGAAQALQHVIEAAHIIGQLGNSNIRFVFVGDGVQAEQLKADVRARNVSNVMFLPRVAPDVAGAIMQEADALLIHLADEPVFRMTIPSKTQAYLASGRPILVAVAGEAADLVRTAGAGVVANPCNPESIASAAVRLAQLSSEERGRMGVAGAEFYRTRLSQAAGVRRTAELLSSIARGSGRQRKCAPMV